MVYQRVLDWLVYKISIKEPKPADTPTTSSEMDTEQMATFLQLPHSMQAVDPTVRIFIQVGKCSTRVYKDGEHLDS